MVLSKCTSSQQCWAVKKPKLTIHAISSSDDAPSSNRMKPRTCCASIGAAFSGHAVPTSRNDQAEMMLAFVQPVPSYLRMSLRSFLPPNVNLLLAQMDCRTVCAALQEALGPSFHSTLSRLFCRHRLSLLALVLAVRCLSLNLESLMPKVSLFVRWNHCDHLQYVIVTARFLPLPCVRIYEDTPSSAFTPRRDASPSVS